MKDRNINGESNVWSAAQRQKMIYGFDVHAGFEGSYGSVGNGKQCSLVWSCVEERIVMFSEGYWILRLMVKRRKGG